MSERDQAIAGDALRSISKALATINPDEIPDEVADNIELCRQCALTALANLPLEADSRE